MPVFLKAAFLRWTDLRPTDPPERTHRWVDLALFLGLFAAGLFQSLHVVAWMDPSLSVEKNARNVWFDSDFARVTTLESDRGGRQTRSNIHPLFSTVAFPPIAAIRVGLRTPAPGAIQIFHSIVAGLWTGLLFLLLRRSGCRRPDSVLFALIAATSTAAIFCLWSPETFALGSLTMMPALFLATREKSPTVFQQIVAQVVGLSVTVTNWGAAALLTLVSETRRRMAVVFAGAAAGFLALCFIQSKLFFDARVPLAGVVSGNTAFLYMPESGGFLACARAFLFHGMVAPEISWLSNFRMPDFPYFSFQASRLFSGPPAGWASTAIWTALLVMGIAAFTRVENRKWKTVLGGMALAQFTLHIAYGRETFLYGLHYVPLLVLVAATASRTRARAVVLALAVLLVPLNYVNNMTQFSWCARYTRRFNRLQEELRKHPIDEAASLARIGISSARQ